MKRLIKAVVMPPLTMLRQWRRRHELRDRLGRVTRDVLVEQLEALDFGRETILLVHTSLKALGFVEGGPASVVEALVEVVVRRRNGTLALPTFSIEGSMRRTLLSGRPFDVRSTPSNLGAIPETFRRYPGVRRSVHPTHSVAALGAMADWIVRDHHLCGTSFGRGSPMARIMEAGGYLAGLGTGLGTVTFYHCLEDLEADFPVSVYSKDSPFRATCVDWNGASHVLELSAHAPEVAASRIDQRGAEPLRRFFASRLEGAAGLRWFPIGEGRGWAVPLQAMYAECRRLMRAGITIYTTADELPELGCSRL